MDGNTRRTHPALLDPPNLKDHFLISLFAFFVVCISDLGRGCNAPPSPAPPVSAWARACPPRFVLRGAVNIALYRSVLIGAAYRFCQQQQGRVLCWLWSLFDGDIGDLVLVSLDYTSKIFLRTYYIQQERPGAFR